MPAYARQIHGAKTRRLKQDRTGHISVPHTLRRNVRYEGIPFNPVLRRHHEKRPRVVMLCDVSMSTRPGKVAIHQELSM